MVGFAGMKKRASTPPLRHPGEGRGPLTQAAQAGFLLVTLVFMDAGLRRHDNEKMLRQ
jgi:hypothetical protein